MVSEDKGQMILQEEWWMSIVFFLFPCTSFSVTRYYCQQDMDASILRSCRMHSGDHHPLTIG